jgi:hypothetical protein
MPHYSIKGSVLALKGGDEMEMDMQDPGDMWAGIVMPVPLVGDRDRGGKTDFG